MRVPNAVHEVRPWRIRDIASGMTLLDVWALPVHGDAGEFGAVIDHALDSDGLSTAAAENAAWLSLVAYARHVFTDYDDLLAQGYDRDSARHFVADEMEAVLSGWGVRRKLGEDS